MDKTSKSDKLFIFFIILSATLFHGGFFAVEYTMIAIAFLIFILFSRKVFVSKSRFFFAFGLMLLYYLSSAFSGYDTGSAITESVKPLLLLIVTVIGVRFEKADFMKSLVIASAALGVIGLFSLCRVIELKDFVYIYDGVRSLQSTMQYANSTAVLLVCGIFSVRALEKNKMPGFVYSITEILLTVCLLFTHSRIAIAVYIVLVILELVLLKDNIPLKFVINLISAVCIYFVMQFLINKKLSFAALIFCIFSGLFVAEAISKIKRTSLKINRMTGIILIVGIISAMLIALFFTDISTIMVRLLYYMDGVKALIHNPLWGLSPGGWSAYQYNYQSAQYLVTLVHNGILQVGLDAGVLAMFLFVALIVISLVGLVKIWKEDKKTNDLYILLVFLTLILHGFLDFDFSYGNILIILGVCISYGCRKMHSLNLKPIHKSLIAVCTVCLVCLGVSEVLLVLGQNEFNKENYPKASKYYETLSKIRPHDVNSEIMWGLCQAKLENTELAEMIIERAYDKHPDNQDIILKAMNTAAENNDFSKYIVCQNQLLKCAPMQQTTYMSAIKYLDDFLRNDVIDEKVYLEEKNKVVVYATEQNEKMKKFNQSLSFGTEIDIDSLK